MTSLSFALALMTARVAVAEHLTRSDETILDVDFDTTTLGPCARAVFDADWPDVRWVSGLDEGAAARAEIVMPTGEPPGRCLCLHYPKGTVGPRDQTIQFMVELSKQRRFESATLRYRVRFGPGLQRRGLRFHDDAKVTIDTLAFSAFFGGHDPTWATERDETICFDDFIITSPR
jgi:hypothetical protein